MRFNAATRVLAVSLTVGLVAGAKPRSRLQAKLGRSESEDASIAIRFRESFTVDETVPVNKTIDLNFLNSDLVECQLSATGPVSFQLTRDALFADKQENGEDWGTLFMKDRCTTFSFNSPTDRSKESLFYITNEDDKGPVQVTGGCTLKSERRGLRAPATRGLKPLQQQTKEGGLTQTIQENLVVAFNSFSPISLGNGLASISWSFTSGGLDVSFMVFETKQWEILQDLLNTNDGKTSGKEGVKECFTAWASSFSDVIQVDPAVAYTFVIFNDDLADANVIGDIICSKP